jgi:hypothetical protein
MKKAVDMDESMIVFDESILLWDSGQFAHPMQKMAIINSKLKQNQETIKNPVLNTLVPLSVFHESSILRTSVGGGNWDSGHPLTIHFAS